MFHPKTVLQQNRGQRYLSIRGVHKWRQQRVVKWWHFMVLEDGGKPNDDEQHNILCKIVNAEQHNTKWWGFKGVSQIIIVMIIIWAGWGLNYFVRQWWRHLWTSPVSTTNKNNGTSWIREGLKKKKRVEYISQTTTTTYWAEERFPFHPLTWLVRF